MKVVVPGLVMEEVAVGRETETPSPRGHDGRGRGLTRVCVERDGDSQRWGTDVGSKVPVVPVGTDGRDGGGGGGRTRRSDPLGGWVWGRGHGLVDSTRSL